MKWCIGGLFAGVWVFLWVNAVAPLQQWLASSIGLSDADALIGSFVILLVLMMLSGAMVWRSAQNM
jgi:hypothetical protein